MPSSTIDDGVKVRIRLGARSDL